MADQTHIYISENDEPGKRAVEYQAAMDILAGAEKGGKILILDTIAYSIVQNFLMVSLAGKDETYALDTVKSLLRIFQICIISPVMRKN